MINSFSIHGNLDYHKVDFEVYYINQQFDVCIRIVEKKDDQVVGEILTMVLNDESLTKLEGCLRSARAKINASRGELVETKGAGFIPAEQVEEIDATIND